MYSNIYVLMSMRPKPTQGCRADDNDDDDDDDLVSGVMLHHLFQAL
jgi:hypothetical protein